MASPCGPDISGLNITSTITRATYPPGPSGHIWSGEERPTGSRDDKPHRARSVRDPAVRPVLVTPVPGPKGVARDRPTRRSDHNPTASPHEPPGDRPGWA